MTVMYDGLLDVHYGFFDVCAGVDPDGDLFDARRGQTNGLCGAKVTTAFLWSLVSTLVMCHCASSGTKRLPVWAPSGRSRNLSLDGQQGPLRGTPLLKHTASHEWHGRT